MRRHWLFAPALALALPSALAAQSAPVAADPVALYLQHNRSADHAVIETPSGLQYKVLTPGSEAARPTADDVALVMYKGSLTDGTVFDQSERPTPMAISEVVPGFSEALTLMARGAKYRVWIKPSLGYGDQASGPIPAHSVLVFDIELIDWKTRAELMRMQQQAQPPASPTVPPAK
jgi:FKBP-type peptidyl-prolyl cis-trans isomerase